MHLIPLNSKTDAVSRRVTSIVVVDDVTLPTNQLTGNDLNTTMGIGKHPLNDVKLVFLMRSQTKKMIEMVSIRMIKPHGIQ